MVFRYIWFFVSRSSPNLAEGWFIRKAEVRSWNSKCKVTDLLLIRNPEGSILVFSFSLYG